MCRCDDDHKFIIVLALIKLQLLVGKTIFFVNTVDRGFKLKVGRNIQIGVRYMLMSSIAFSGEV